MGKYREIDGPAPTIVGPRPITDGAGKVTVPQGIERLLTLAGLSAEWRGHILTDPVAAAREARIELSPNEVSILRTVPRATLAGMADSFARKHGSGLGAKVAAGAAAAAVIATTLLGWTQEAQAVLGTLGDVPPPKPAPPATDGIRPDVPDAAPQIAWFDTLDDALALAKKSNRAVMAVFLHPKPATERQPMVPVAGIAPRVITAEETSQKVCQTDSKEFRFAVRDAALLAARITKPVYALTGKETPVEVAQAQERHEEAARRYEALLKKYEIADKLPAVVFTAPDGSALSVLTQPAEEAKLIDGVKAVPPLLAKWLVKNRPGDPAGVIRGIRPDIGPVAEGIRPDIPATRGIQPDVPKR